MPVAVDIRMAKHSGIGTYIRQVVPRVFSHSRSMSPVLLGEAASLRDIVEGSNWAASPHAIPCSTPIYSIREQIRLPLLIPRDARVFWAPHYNIPLLHTGRLAVTVHDALHLARPEFVKGLHQKLYARTLFEGVRRKASAIFCDSRFTADELLRLVGIDAKKLHVVHLGVDERWFDARGEHRPYSAPYFVFVGNVKPHKNLARLVRAFRAVAGEIPQDLVIVGRREGFITGDPEVKAEAGKLGGRVTFTGEMSERDVMNFVGHADALILPSLYEGFGLPAVEAMAAGCPLLVSNAASLPEVCGDAAIYFDPRNEAALAAEMKRLARDDFLRRDLVAAGRERARLFNWDRTATETREVLMHVAS